MRVCNQPGCPELTDGPRCETHQPKPWERNGRRPQQTSRQQRARIHDRDHRTCQLCRNAAGTEVDHIVPVFEGGTSNDDNLWLLCRDCHDRKTSGETARARWPTT